jgi:hypothetical protein
VQGKRAAQLQRRITGNGITAIEPRQLENISDVNAGDDEQTAAPQQKTSFILHKIVVPGAAATYHRSPD